MQQVRVAAYPYRYPAGFQSMFSLIITIISIALVAVLALATLYYGGDAFNKGTADAQATKAINQGQQLLAAAELYTADSANANQPMTMARLISGGYLKAVPVAYQGNGSVAQAWAATEWQMPTEGTPVFVAPMDATSACSSVNQRITGTNEVLDAMYPDLGIQCYSDAEADLKVVASKNGSSLVTVTADPSQTLLLATDLSATAYSAAPTTPTTPVDPLAPFLIKATAQYSGSALHLNLRALGGQNLTPYVAGIAMFQAVGTTSGGTACNLGPNWTDTYGSPTQLTWPAWPDLVTVDPVTALGADPSSLDLTMYAYNNLDEVGNPSNNLDTMPLSLWDTTPCIETGRVIVGDLGGWFSYSDMVSESPESKSICLSMTYNAVLGRHVNNGNFVPCP